jgi:glycosyltransferase involved in cell wall biosynthesis
MGLGVPLIVSDIEENEFAVQDTALKFRKSDVVSLTGKINFAEDNHALIKALADRARQRALREFNWDKVTDDHIQIFKQKK